MSSASSTQARLGKADKVVRHGSAARVLHWSAAVAVLILLATAFLPIVGWRFPWVDAHWTTGFVLMLIVIVHVLQATIRSGLSPVLIGAEDLRDGLAAARFNLRRTAEPPPRAGKYSLAQKLIHLAFAIAVLAELLTGAMMMVKIDTPWWDRNLYWLTDAAWGWVYVVHGLAALLLITMVMIHVYFGLRPEKRRFLRAMLLGWMTRREYEANHDARRWRIEQ